MSIALTAEERLAFRGMVGPALRACVRQLSREIDDPAELELAAADLLALPGLVEVHEVVTEAIEVVAAEPGGELLLRALAWTAPPTVAALARASLGEAARTGPVAGALVVEEAWELDAGEPVTSLLLVARREGRAGRQLFAFVLEWPRSGGALKDGFATGTLSDEELAGTLADASTMSGLTLTRLEVDAAIGRIASGAEACAQIGAGPGPDAFAAVALLLRSAGLPDAEKLLAALVDLPLLADVLDDELDPDGPDDAELGRRGAAIDELVDELARCCEDEGTLFVCGAMGEFRAFYSDGDPAAWTLADLEEFLLDWAPRKVSFAEESIDAVPQSVASVLRFLGESGRLPAKRAETLARHALVLGDEFAAAARDPRCFGPAKAFGLAMTADGVDMADPDAVQAWIDAFNARPREERERVVPSLSLPSLPAVAAPGRQKPAATKKTRKAQRQARRRNRRGG